jgi:hypothetical protein
LKKDYIIKFILPVTQRDNAIDRLLTMNNISHSTLFPGLDVFARSLGIITENKWNNFYTVEKEANEKYKKGGK